MTDDNNDDYEPYNGAYKGYSPFDMDADECRPRCDYDPCDVCDDAEDDDGDYDYCDDAEDYGEDKE